MLLRDIKEFSEAVVLFEKAINGYAESGSLDTAAMTVEKAADVLKNDNPKEALQVRLNFWKIQKIRPTNLKN